MTITEVLNSSKPFMRPGYYNNAVFTLEGNQIVSLDGGTKFRNIPVVHCCATDWINVRKVKKEKR